MDEAQFKQELERDGFAEGTVVTWQPNSVNGDHSHDFTARGLVRSGSFVLGCNGTEKTYSSGDIFELEAGAPHTETAGPEGASFLVGRK